MRNRSKCKSCGGVICKTLYYPDEYFCNCDFFKDRVTRPCSLCGKTDIKKIKQCDCKNEFKDEK